MLINSKTTFIEKIIILLMIICMFNILASDYITLPLDMGPKPSVTVYIKGVDGETVYGTFIVGYGGTPWDPTIEDDIINKMEVFPVDGEFRVEKSYMQDCTKSMALYEAYMPPDEFKILLYFPDYNTFVTTNNIYNAYAFHSHYSLDLSGYDFNNNRNATIVADAQVHSAQMRDRILGALSFLFRLAVTVAVEFAVGWLIFKIREKENVRTIIIVNVITQFLLNFFILDITYGIGLILALPFGEIVVFIVEAIAYKRLFSEPRNSTGKVIGYSFVANAITMFLGYFLAAVEFLMSEMLVVMF